MLIKGKNCRWYAKGYLWVSYDGYVIAVSDKKNKSGIKIIKIQTDANGRKYVEHPYGYVVYVARAVITCFCPSHPADGKEYTISYKDGNVSNCHYKNLEWVQYHYPHATSASVVVSVKGLDLTVNRDGSIEMNGKKMEVRDHFYDADVDLEVCSWCPFVDVPQKNSIYRASIFIDDLMKKAGYVQGDDANLTSPVILHKDNNYMNCDSDNLEWVEEADQRYQDFLKQKKIDFHNKVVKNNPGKYIPQGM